MNGGSRNFGGNGRKLISFGKISSILPIPPKTETGSTSSDSSREEGTKGFGILGKHKFSEEEKDAPKNTEPSTSKDRHSEFEKGSSDVVSDSDKNGVSVQKIQKRESKFDLQETVESTKAVTKNFAVEENRTVVMEQGNKEMLCDVPSSSQSVTNADPNAKGSAENQKSSEDVHLSDDDSGNSAENHLPGGSEQEEKEDEKKKAN